MKEAMLKAFDLKRKGYYKQAIETYYKLMSKVGSDVEILTELSDLYYLLKNNERARHYISKVLEINPEHVNSLVILKNVELSENNCSEAERIAKNIYELTKNEADLAELLNILELQSKYNEIIELAQNTTNAECIYKYALAKYKQDKFNDAKEILENAITNKIVEIEGNNYILELLGKIYFEQNEKEKANEVFKKLENNNTDTAESLNFIGLNKLEELKPDEALNYFQQAVEKEDQNAEFHYNMGQAYYLKGWFEEAKKCFNTAICINPTEERYHYSLAYLLYRCEDYDNAKNHLNPEFFDSKVLLEVIKFEKGNLAAPKTELEKMMADNPDNELILSSLGKIYFKLDMFKQAKNILEKVIELKPKNFEHKSLYVKTLFKLNLFKEAKEQIEELVEKYPNFYYAKVLEAEFYLENDDYDNLFDTAQELIELDINHYEGYYYNALALFEKEDVNFAIESLKKAITLDVSNAELYVKMSEFYQSIGRYEDAFEYIKEASDIDKSARNKELYIQLASIIRKKK